MVTVFKKYAVGRTADREHDFFDVFGAGVWEGEFIAQAGGIKAFAGEEFVVESLEIRDVGVAVEQARDFVKRGSALGALHGERYARGV